MEELSLEQKFEIKKLAEQAKKMSREELEQALLLLYTQLLFQKTIYKKMLEINWGL